MNIAAHHSMMLMAASPTPPAPAYWGLCFTAEEPNVVVNMTKSGTPPAVTLETSPDGLTWIPFDADSGTTPVALANIGDKVYFRAGNSGNTVFGISGSAYRRFSITGLCAASGNINSILNANSQDVALSSNYALASIFRDCTSLTTAPELPATTLASRCYYRMFYGCTSLTTAPELPATTLASNCYQQMFYGCTSLTTAPELPATTLADSCYSRMFYGCTSLNNIKALFSLWSPTNSTSTWVSNVSASGTFRCPTALGTDATITRGTSNCPEGWTVINID